MSELALKTGKAVAGKALYLEFIKTGYTIQIVVTPEFIGSSGKVVAGNFLYRRMNSVQVRKNWNFNPTRQGATTKSMRTIVDDKYVYKTTTDAMAYAEHILAGLSGYLNAVFHQDYKLNKNPISVEVTYEELYEIENGKTPTGLIRRITRSRDAKEFGDLVKTTV